jgi:glucosamine--fructose-6-phosphate aminotransferase (isomerizing)
MAEEIRAAPAAVARQRDALRPLIAELVARLRRRPPDVIVTCARGSSAHAATFGKHLIERYLGVPVAAAAPSIASVYGRRLRLRNQLFLAISQSGRSDDLIAMARSARASGALTVAIANETASPLATICDIVLPMSAERELSVAATKTFVATTSTLLRLVAAWNGDGGFDAALERLPQRLALATELDWNAATHMITNASSLAVLGRGPTLAIAREAALKLKETCNVPAEAFSGAEFLHGPVALASPRHPVLMLMPCDAASRAMRQLASRLRREATPLLIAGPGRSRHGQLPILDQDHPDVDAVCLIQSFYALTLRLAGLLEIDVDHPRQLHKVTRTI